MEENTNPFDKFDPFTAHGPHRYNWFGKEGHRYSGTGTFTFFREDLTIGEMGKLKTSLDVLHILEELNIPAHQFEQWTIEATETESFPLYNPEPKPSPDNRPRQILEQLYPFCV